MRLRVTDDARRDRARPTITLQLLEPACESPSSSAACAPPASACAARDGDRAGPRRTRSRSTGSRSRRGPTARSRSTSRGGTPGSPPTARRHRRPPRARPRRSLNGALLLGPEGRHPPHRRQARPATSTASRSPRHGRALGRTRTLLQARPAGRAPAASSAAPTSDEPIVVTPGKADRGGVRAAALRRPQRLDRADRPRPPRRRLRRRGPVEISARRQAARRRSRTRSRATPASATARSSTPAPSVTFGTPGIGPLGPCSCSGSRSGSRSSPSRASASRRSASSTSTSASSCTTSPAAGSTSPNFDIDHGIPTFALCGEVGLTAGPTVLGAAADPPRRRASASPPTTTGPRCSARSATSSSSRSRSPTPTSSCTPTATPACARAVRLGHRRPRHAQGRPAVRDAGAEVQRRRPTSTRAWSSSTGAPARRRSSPAKGVAVCLKIDLLFDDWKPGLRLPLGRAAPDAVLRRLRRRPVQGAHHAPGSTSTSRPCRRRSSASEQVDRAPGRPAGRDDRRPRPGRAAEAHADRPEGRAHHHAGRPAPGRAGAVPGPQGPAREPDAVRDRQAERRAAGASSSSPARPRSSRCSPPRAWPAGDRGHGHRPRPAPHARYYVEPAGQRSRSSSAGRAPASRIGDATARARPARVPPGAGQGRAAHDRRARRRPRRVRGRALHRAGRAAARPPARPARRAARLDAAAEVEGGGRRRPPRGPRTPRRRPPNDVPHPPLGPHRPRGPSWDAGGRERSRPARSRPRRPLLHQAQRMTTEPRSKAAMMHDTTEIAAAGLAGIAALHALWAAGSTWPLADRNALADAVCGRTDGSTPGPLTCLTVSGLLAGAAGLVGGYPRRAPRLRRAGAGSGHLGARAARDAEPRGARRPRRPERRVDAVPDARPAGVRAAVLHARGARCCPPRSSSPRR